MNPKEYYYGNFREQFAEFYVKAKMAHVHPGEGIYIPIQDLNKENLSHISQKEYALFNCSLTCTILIDQVMYTHFKKDYRKFQTMTLYPKIEYGISNTNIRPWDIIRYINEETLKEFLEFFVTDLRDFFQQNAFQDATWEAVKSAMLKDTDVGNGPHGELMRRSLENISGPETTKKPRAFVIDTLQAASEHL